MQILLLIDFKCSNKNLSNLFLVKVIKELHINWIKIKLRKINKFKKNIIMRNKHNYDITCI